MPGYKIDKITEQLEIAFKEKKRKLTAEEVRESTSLPDPAEYAYHYGTYEKAASYVWRKINPEEHPVMLTPMAMALLKKKEEEKKEKKD